jgi:hypothetical protein
VKELALIVVTVLLTALVGRIYGPRRLLHRAREQLEVLNVTPSAWSSERSKLEKLAKADLAEYIQLRTRRTPVHYTMLALTNFGIVAMLLFLASDLDAFPGGRSTKDLVQILSLTVVATAVLVNLALVVGLRKEIDRELTDGA